ncbi:uncharacterized protein AMSG_03082 [Thecamonas trahens ATCC 50062]|uniref:Uncharacterized protein n=1 Tax=Thecamonas trahens ATCC 50062 TaxID=461836 RepID=A0A0L0D397_THETB|nr:hypothetical protein AMSG_03082 [Thecamonas trahens ATCC 50062]KNC46645.1 hypothetical protein AMSG_03082 [Thecamonas trahens ATCC 50062]|eukprot:XP_013760418.1 hypothetical protein AMSG_03082 [Thecamonas trahens ATCC 50062]
MLAGDWVYARLEVAPVAAAVVGAAGFKHAVESAALALLGPIGGAGTLDVLSFNEESGETGSASPRR